MPVDHTCEFNRTESRTTCKSPSLFVVYFHTVRCNFQSLPVQTFEISTQNGFDLTSPLFDNRKDTNISIGFHSVLNFILVLIIKAKMGIESPFLQQVLQALHHRNSSLARSRTNYLNLRSIFLPLQQSTFELVLRDIREPYRG